MLADPLTEAPDCPAGQFEVRTGVLQSNGFVPSLLPFHIVVL